MEDLVRQALSILKGMWQYRWPALVASWVAAIVGIVVVFKIPDQFEASARIYVDTQSILKPLMAGMTVQPNVQQQVAMLSRTLVSRPNVEKLIRMADLDLKSVSKMEQEELIARLTQDIQIRNTGRDNLYTLNFRDTDPEKAKRVIQSLVSIFIESSLGASRKDTDSARTFLAEQIKQHEAVTALLGIRHRRQKCLYIAVMRLGLQLSHGSPPRGSTYRTSVRSRHSIIP